MIIKYFLLLTIVCCTACLLPNKRTTEIIRHLYSQRDRSFYFSDCIISNRPDSFYLARIGGSMKFFNAPNLSQTSINQVRFVYDRAFDEPYFISLSSDGDLTISTLDTFSYLNGTQYQSKEDTLQFSDAERKILRFTKMYNTYRWHEMPDSAAMLKKQYPEFVDSLYDLHLRLMSRIPLNDTITIVKTILHRQSETFKAIALRLERINFWDMPIYENGNATDGSSWTLEAKINGRHHASCKVNVPNEAFEGVCKMLLKFTPIPAKDIY